MQRKSMTLMLAVALLATLGLLGSGCMKAKINLFPDYTEPLQEYVLEGKAEGKVLMIPIRGMVSQRSREGFFGTRPSMVQEVRSALDMARKDEQVKAILLQIDSPGGSVTASDIIYNEIKRYKEETGVKVSAVMMDLAASGGYYVAMAAERVYAHPTTVTGSIGVIFYTISIDGLFNKIGVKAEPIKSGKHKDMGSPFRDMNEEEREILQNMIDEMYGRFVKVVADGRPQLNEQAVRQLADGRIYTAKQALDAKLIDEIAYMDQALSDLKMAAGISQDSRVVVYRRQSFGNDNIYNTRTAKAGGQLKLIDLPFSSYMFTPQTGFYYIWEPGLTSNK